MRSALVVVLSVLLVVCVVSCNTQEHSGGYLADRSPAVSQRTSAVPFEDPSSTVFIEADSESALRGFVHDMEASENHASVLEPSAAPREYAESRSPEEPVKHAESIDNETLVRSRQRATEAAHRMARASEGELWAKPVLRSGVLCQEAKAFPLKHTHVEASVAGYVATTSVTQTYENPFDKAIEAVYIFPLPENAAINHFMMVIGERHILGVIRRREQAQEIYQQARAQGYTASLLEQERPNIFTQSVANIAAYESVEVEINYVNRLKYRDGQYEYVFPMVVGERYLGHTHDAERISSPVLPPRMRNGHNVSLNLSLDAGSEIGAIDTPLHYAKVKRDGDTRAVISLVRQDEVPNRDFVLRYRLLDDQVQTGVLTHANAKHGGFVSLMFTPPEMRDAAEVMPREITFLMDVSGSMSGAPIEASKKIVIDAIMGLRPHDRFNIFFFAGSNGQLWNLPQPNTSRNRRTAISFVEDMDASGGTEMLAGLQRLFDSGESEDALRMVLFLTDGKIGNEEQILSLVQREAYDARFFAFGIGDDINRYLIEGVGKHGRGYASVVLTGERGATEAAVQDFYSHIDAPLLTDIEVDWGTLDVDQQYPSVIPDVFDGHPIQLIARYSKASSGHATVRARYAGERVSFKVPLRLPERENQNTALASVWARAKIEDLSDRRLSKRGEQYSLLSEEITETALDFSLVSEGTSFVAVDSSQRVGDGNPSRIDVPVERPEGVGRRSSASGE